MTIFVVLVLFLSLLTLANLAVTAAERRRPR
jgi:hypothetical protein